MIRDPRVAFERLFGNGRFPYLGRLDRHWSDLFRYDENALSGLRVLLTPVEDLAWPLACALGLLTMLLLASRVTLRRAIRPAGTVAP